MIRGLVKCVSPMRSVQTNAGLPFITSFEWPAIENYRKSCGLILMLSIGWPRMMPEPTVGKNPVGSLLTVGWLKRTISFGRGR